jgi:hypothetical protein
MNCFDCAALKRAETAVAVCADCGAGVCIAHAHVDVRWLTRTAVINRTVVVEPPARVVRCVVCHAAHTAAVAGTPAAVR